MLNNYAQQLKAKLDNIISEMSTNPGLFAETPGKDFIRDRKLSFNKLIHLLLGMRGKTISQEIYDYFQTPDEIMTTSAFIQQREKLLPEAMEYIFKEFNRECKDTKTYNGYHLYAVDGSDINIATNPNSKDTYIQSKRKSKKNKEYKGYNQFHLNALYDLMNKTYADAIIQPIHQQNEYKAAIEMVNRTAMSDKSIIIADRGYCSYNLFAHLSRKQNVDYLIRIRHDLVIVKDLALEEADREMEIELRKTQTKEDKELYKNNQAVFLAQGTTFDFDCPYKMKIRVVRVKISPDTYETIITSLNRFEFPMEKIKELYQLRWGIETSFRELKYAIGLVNFHAKKEKYIKQEIYARLTMYNFCERITNLVVIKQDKDKKWTYKVNYTMGIYICIKYFRQQIKEREPDIERLMTKYILPIREGRKDKRKIAPKSAVYFLYRVA